MESHYGGGRPSFLRGRARLAASGRIALSRRASRLGRRAARVRRRRRGDRVGLGARLGHALVPGLLPGRRAADGAAARDRLTDLRAEEVGCAARVHLGWALGRARARDARVWIVRHRRSPPRRITSTGYRGSSRSPATASGRSRSSSLRSATIRRRPVGNAFILAGVAVAAAGSTLSGLGVSATSGFALLAVVLLYLGVAEPSLTLITRRASRAAAR